MADSWGPHATATLSYVQVLKILGLAPGWHALTLTDSALVAVEDASLGKRSSVTRPRDRMS